MAPGSFRSFLGLFAENLGSQTDKILFLATPDCLSELIFSEKIMSESVTFGNPRISFVTPA